MRLKVLSLLFLMCFSVCCLADAVDLYPFVKTQHQEQFSRLTNQIRCLICQNESIADSSAPIANDLRQKVYEMVKEGSTDQQIKHFLVDRYGEFVLFKPRLSSQTAFLWAAPILFLIIGFTILLVRIRRSQISEVQS